MQRDEIHRRRRQMSGWGQTSSCASWGCSASRSAAGGGWRWRARSGLALLAVAALAAGARADAIRILDDPREAAQARVDLIQQARGEINAVYFLARNDRITTPAERRVGAEGST